MEEITKKRAQQLLIEADIRECSCNQQFLEDLVRDYYELRCDTVNDMQNEINYIWPGQYKIEQ